MHKPQIISNLISDTPFDFKDSWSFYQNTGQLLLSLSWFVVRVLGLMRRKWEESMRSKGNGEDRQILHSAPHYPVDNWSLNILTEAGLEAVLGKDRTDVYLSSEGCIRKSRAKWQLGLKKVGLDSGILLLCPFEERWKKDDVETIGKRTKVNLETQFSL